MVYYLLVSLEPVPCQGSLVGGAALRTGKLRSRTSIWTMKATVMGSTAPHVRLCVLSMAGTLYFFLPRHDMDVREAAVDQFVVNSGPWRLSWG